MNDILNKVTVIDDLIPSSISNTMKDYLFNVSRFKFLPLGTSQVPNNFFSEKGVNSVFEQFQFVDNVKDHENYFDVSYWHFFSLPLTLALWKLGLTCNFNEIKRCKLNLQTKAPKESINKYNFPHTDFIPEMENELTMIYYVNDCDGDTYIFDSKNHSMEDIKKTPEQYDNLKILKRISPKQGRAVIFPTSQLHAGSHPIKSEYRMVLNYNFQAQTHPSTTQHSNDIAKLIFK